MFQNKFYSVWEIQKKHAKTPNHAIYSSPHRVEKLKLKKKILRIISNNYPFSYICKVL